MGGHSQPYVAKRMYLLVIQEEDNIEDTETLLIL